MSVQECQEIIRAAETADQWSLALHTPYPTLDLHAADVPAILQLLNRKLGSEFLPLLANLFNVNVQSIWVKEVVVIKYQAQGAQAHVAEHRDSSFLSFNVLLNPASDFDGGGTHFADLGRTVYLAQGDAVLHSGKLLHSGLPVARGTRYLLAGFAQLRHSC